MGELNELYDDELLALSFGIKATKKEPAKDVQKDSNISASFLIDDILQEERHIPQRRNSPYDIDDGTIEEFSAIDNLFPRSNLAVSIAGSLMLMP